jgi:hypothetical protein
MVKAVALYAKDVGVQVPPRGLQLGESYATSKKVRKGSS